MQYFFFKFQVFKILLQEKWPWALLQHVNILGFFLLKHIVYLLTLDTHFLLSTNVMIVRSVSTFNPSVLDSPQDQVCYISHIFYKLVLKSLNKSQKLQVNNFLLKKQKLGWREWGEAVLHSMPKDCALRYARVTFSHCVIDPEYSNRYRAIIMIRHLYM